MLLTPEIRTLYEAASGTPYRLQPKMSEMPIPKRFYCRWLLPVDTKQYDPVTRRELVNDPLGRCCFNHRFGLPLRKWENPDGTADIRPVELTGFNLRTIQNYLRYPKYSKCKCRGDGTTEILTVRWNIFKYGVLTNIRNHKGLIMPGTSSKLSHEISSRIKALCDRVPQIYRSGMSPTSNAPPQFYFRFGRLELTTATPDASRGYEGVGDINQEEVHHWNMVDDRPVYYSSEGVHEKTRCHITHNTTPNKRRGFYWDVIWAPDARSDYYRHVVNWREVVGLPVERIEDLYDEGTIDEGRLLRLRKGLIRRYDTDAAYRRWYETFEKSGVRVFWHQGSLIPIRELCDVPVPILDINAIIRDSVTERSHYDQELDNEFLTSDARAIGDFAEAEYSPDDLRAQIARFGQAGGFDPSDYE